MQRPLSTIISDTTKNQKKEIKIDWKKILHIPKIVSNLKSRILKFENFRQLKFYLKHIFLFKWLDLKFYLNQGFKFFTKIPFKNEKNTFHFCFVFAIFKNLKPALNFICIFFVFVFVFAIFKNLKPALNFTCILFKKPGN